MGFKGLKKYQKNVKTKLDDKLHKVTRQAFYNLVTMSPVDTGNFRGNWFGSILTAFKGDPNAQIFQTTTTVGITRGTPPTALEQSHLSPALRAKFGQTVYITNNLNYAQSLENGHSKQAPSGVLHVATQRTKAEISK